MSVSTQLVRSKVDSECDEILSLDLQKHKQTKFNFQLLQINTLKILNIQGIDNEQFMILLCNGLKSNQSITNLTVSWYYEIAGLKAISEVIKSNTTISQLHIWEFQHVHTFPSHPDLEKNKIDCLAQALKVNATLTSLCLVSDNTNYRGMSNGNIKTLLAALEHHDSLFDVKFLPHPYPLKSHPTVKIMDDFLASNRMIHYGARMRLGERWGLVSIACNFHRANIHSSFKDSFLNLLPMISAFAENTAASQPQYTAEDKANKLTERLTKYEIERKMVSTFMATKFFKAIRWSEKVAIPIFSAHPLSSESSSNSSTPLTASPSPSPILNSRTNTSCRSSETGAETPSPIYTKAFLRIKEAPPQTHTDAKISNQISTQPNTPTNISKTCTIL